MANKKITIDEVKHIAKLSKLDIPNDKLNYYVSELSQILDYFDVISKVDTSNVEPLINVSDNINIYRNDKSEAGINKNEFIENCPETFGNYIKVPKVLDKDK
tara:strand:- start:6730 stop:7035 length:306 start_codon:yes stop_codon:yes gene_type:complete